MGRGDVSEIRLSCLHVRTYSLAPPADRMLNLASLMF